MGAIGGRTSVVEVVDSCIPLHVIFEGVKRTKEGTRMGTRVETRVGTRVGDYSGDSSGD